MYLIYKIINKINNKIYVGYTYDIKMRWGAHLKAANNMDHKHLYHAMRHYGIENFSIEIIESNIKTQIEALERETYWIQELNTLSKNGKGYNLLLHHGRRIVDEKVICTNCNKFKFITEFHKRQGGSLGIASHCKECKSLYRKENSDKAKIYIKAYKQANYKRLKLHLQKYRNKNRELIRLKDKQRQLNIPDSIKGVYNKIVKFYNNESQRYCCSCKQILQIENFKMGHTGSCKMCIKSKS